ncbi:MAG: hypothetical protein HWD59_03640 [Coxiellaceae bacterium]|nr:MAG: hypothetical protein HWD59_03640 [Coxiellaceae bacterium]
MQELESVGDIAIKAATQKYFGNQIEFDDVRQYRPFLFDTFRELINTSGPRGIFGAPSGHEFDKN